MKKQFLEKKHAQPLSVEEMDYLFPFSVPKTCVKKAPSVEALGLLVYFVYKESVNHTDAKKHFNIGENKYRRILRELTKEGLISLRRIKAQDGRFIDTKYSILN